MDSFLSEGGDFLVHLCVLCISYRVQLPPLADWQNTARDTGTLYARDTTVVLRALSGWPGRWPPGLRKGRGLLSPLWA